MAQQLADRRVLATRNDELVGHGQQQLHDSGRRAVVFPNWFAIAAPLLSHEQVAHIVTPLEQLQRSDIVGRKEGQLGLARTLIIGAAILATFNNFQ